MSKKEDARPSRLDNVQELLHGMGQIETFLRFQAERETTYWAIDWTDVNVYLHGSKQLDTKERSNNRKAYTIGSAVLKDSLLRGDEIIAELHHLFNNRNDVFYILPSHLNECYDFCAMARKGLIALDNAGKALNSLEADRPEIINILNALGGGSGLTEEESEKLREFATNAFPKAISDCSGYLGRSFDQIDKLKNLVNTRQLSLTHFEKDILAPSGLAYEDVFPNEDEISKLAASLPIKKPSAARIDAEALLIVRNCNQRMGPKRKKIFFVSGTDISIRNFILKQEGEASSESSGAAAYVWHPAVLYLYLILKERYEGNGEDILRWIGTAKTLLTYIKPSFEKRGEGGERPSRKITPLNDTLYERFMENWEKHIDFYKSLALSKDVVGMLSNEGEPDENNGANLKGNWPEEIKENIELLLRLANLFQNQEFKESIAIKMEEVWSGAQSTGSAFGFINGLTLDRLKGLLRKMAFDSDMVDALQNDQMGPEFLVLKSNIDGLIQQVCFYSKGIIDGIVDLKRKEPTSNSAGSGEFSIPVGRLEETFSVLKSCLEKPETLHESFLLISYLAAIKGDWDFVEGVLQYSATKANLEIDASHNAEAEGEARARALREANLSEKQAVEMLYFMSVAIRKLEDDKFRRQKNKNVGGKGEGYGDWLLERYNGYRSSLEMLEKAMDYAARESSNCAPDVQNISRVNTGQKGFHKAPCDPRLKKEKAVLHYKLEKIRNRLRSGGFPEPPGELLEKSTEILIRAIEYCSSDECKGGCRLKISILGNLAYQLIQAEQPDYENAKIYCDGIDKVFIEHYNLKKWPYIVDTQLWVSAKIAKRDGDSQALHKIREALKNLNKPYSDNKVEQIDQWLKEMK